MSMIKEFKEFAMRGNVLDLAVGIIIGGAFGKIVSSFVSDVMMPPLGKLMGGVNFADRFFVLGDGKEVKGPYLTLVDAKAAGASTLNYGLFANAVIDFLLVAFAVFILIKQVNRFKAKPAPAPTAESTTKECKFCCATIPIRATKCQLCTSQLA